jgi:hypothetical protein
LLLLYLFHFAAADNTIFFYVVSVTAVAGAVAAVAAVAAAAVLVCLLAIDLNQCTEARAQCNVSPISGAGT